MNIKVLTRRRSISLIKPIYFMKGVQAFFINRQKPGSYLDLVILTQLSLENTMSFNKCLAAVVRIPVTLTQVEMFSELDMSIV